jgi:hypothetical protein
MAATLLGAAGFDAAGFDAAGFGAAGFAAGFFSSLPLPALPADAKTSEGATCLGAGLGGAASATGCCCFLLALRSTACRHLTALHRLSIRQFVSFPSCAQRGRGG